jgi:hypothetical protein
MSLKHIHSNLKRTVHFCHLLWQTRPKLATFLFSASFHITRIKRRGKHVSLSEYLWAMANAENRFHHAIHCIKCMNKTEQGCNCEYRILKIFKYFPQHKIKPTESIQCLCSVPVNTVAQSNLLFLLQVSGNVDILCPCHKKGSNFALPNLVRVNRSSDTRAWLFVFVRELLMRKKVSAPAWRNVKIIDFGR